MQVAVREFVDEKREEKWLVPVRAPHILLAEDDPALRLLICFVLQRRGFEVEMVEDGGAALEQLGSLVLGQSRDCLPDLIITDYRMPKFDGLDVIEAIRLVGDHTPIILITAFGDPETHARAERLGVTAVLDKPFELDELVWAAQRATTYWV